MIKKINVSIVLIVLVATILIAVVIVVFDNRIKMIEGRSETPGNASK